MKRKKFALEPYDRLSTDARQSFETLLFSASVLVSVTNFNLSNPL